jgi:hypothetical protein
MSADPRLHFSNASCWLGSWRNVSLQFWSGHVTMTEIDQAGRLTDTLVARCPEGLVSFAVIQTNALPKLGEAERTKIGKINKSLVGRLRANVQVVEGAGFAGSGVRAILAGINLLNPNRGKIFEDVASAARWLTQPPLAIEGDLLIAAVESARAGWARAR